MRRYSRSPVRSAGFTLIELLVAVAILALLGAIVGPRIIGQFDKAQSQAAKVQVEDLMNALHMYRLEVGSYPAQDAGLGALIEAPQGVVGWNGPYLSKKRVPKDPWGREYQYRNPGEHGDVDVFSYGADNNPGGEKDDADVVSWE